MAPDFTSSGKAYAATSGPNSAFSCTTDGGTTWNQLSLIDTEISNIVDLAPSPTAKIAPCLCSHQAANTVYGTAQIAAPHGKGYLPAPWLMWTASV